MSKITTRNRHRHRHRYGITTGLRKYTPAIVRLEANLYLSGSNMKEISQLLRIPVSTVSWHLIYPLYSIDFDLWKKVRSRNFKYAKDGSRVDFEEYIVNYVYKINNQNTIVKEETSNEIKNN